jgi:hypothetical protein
MGCRIKPLLLLTLWVVVIFFNLDHLYAEQLTIQPGPEDGDDSYISELCGEDKKNFGYSEELYIGYYDCKRILLHFDLSPVPSSATVSSAELSLYLNTRSCGGNDYQNTKIYLHRITNFWKEGEVTWKDRYKKERWDSPGGDFDWCIESSVSLTNMSSGWVSWNVTRIIKDWFSGEYVNFGFLLRQEKYNRNENRFFSSEIPWVEFRPKLVITYELKEAPPEEAPPEPVSAPIKVYPNPFKPTAGHTEVKFINLPSAAVVKIFNIEGAIIKTLQEKGGEAKWDVKDNQGNNMSSGFYLYLIETERKRQTGKIVVIR